jgi:hypothetical protein
MLGLPVFAAGAAVAGFLFCCAPAAKHTATKIRVAKSDLNLI